MFHPVISSSSRNNITQTNETPDFPRIVSRYSEPSHARKPKALGEPEVFQNEAIYGMIRQHGLAIGVDTVMNLASVDEQKLDCRARGRTGKAGRAAIEHPSSRHERTTTNMRFFRVDRRQQRSAGFRCCGHVGSFSPFPSSRKLCAQLTTGGDTIFVTEIFPVVRTNAVA